MVVFLYRLLVCGGFLYGLLVCDGFSYELSVCDGFFRYCQYAMVFYVDCFLLNYFLVWKGVMCMFEGRVKMCECCGYAF